MSKLTSDDERNLAKLGSYHQAVLKLLLEVPEGKVTTYGALAKAIAKRDPQYSPKASRAVGTAMKRNPCAPRIPCHRVIKSNGLIGNFMGGAQGAVERKIAMLEKEGVKVNNGKIDLGTYGYFFDE